jgi:hypothetical protein
MERFAKMARHGMLRRLCAGVVLVILSVSEVVAVDVSENGLSAAIEARISELRPKLLARSQQDGFHSKAPPRDEIITVEALAKIASTARTRNESSLYRQALIELSKYQESNTAIRALIANVDEPESPAPRMTQRPLEHRIAAPALIRCGSKVRHYIVESLSNPQSERRLHILAYVLADMDQDKDQPFSVDVTVLRLTNVLKHVDSLPSRHHESQQVMAKNLLRMIEIMQQPQFSVKGFPSE